MGKLSHNKRPAALSVRPIYDFVAIKKIYDDPYIKKVGHDFRPASPIIHDNAYYFGAYIDDQLVGLFLMIDTNYIDVDVHSLLTRKALRYCRELGRLCIDVIFSNKDIQRLTGWVTEGLETALNYDLKIGFKYEGFKRDALLVNGELKGLHLVGLTRKDWEK